MIPHLHHDPACDLCGFSFIPWSATTLCPGCEHPSAESTPDFIAELKTLAETMRSRHGGFTPPVYSTWNTADRVAIATFRFLDAGEWTPACAEDLIEDPRQAHHFREIAEAVAGAMGYRAA